MRVGVPNRQSCDYAPLELARANTAATFLVEPGLAQLLFKINSAATSADGILTTFKPCDNR